MQPPRPPASRPPAGRPRAPRPPADERRPLAPGVQTRVLAAQVLDAVVHRGRSLKSELAAVLPRLADPRDRALLEAIAFEALRGRHRYAPALEGWLQKPPGPNDGPLLALLLAGCLQLSLGRWRGRPLLLLPPLLPLLLLLLLLLLLGWPHVLCAGLPLCGLCCWCCIAG